MHKNMNIHVLVAGPGTGKTSKIVEKVKTIKDLDSIMVISFTNATVNDLRKKIKDKAGIDIPELKCSTLHRLALRLASPTRQYVLTEGELSMVQRDAKVTGTNYEKLCEKLNCKDFNQIIRIGTRYLKTNPTLVKERLGTIDLLLVDEFQDFNSEEQEFVTMLAKFTKETWIIGDDDQAIYDFKNANPQGIIDMHKDPKHFRIEHEGICYRCPKNVVEIAKKLIAKNTNRIDKKWIAKGTSGGLKVAQFLTKANEVDAVVQEIKQILTNEPTASILVLYANKIALHDLHEKLSSEKIKFNKSTKETSEFMLFRHLIYILLGKDALLHLRLLLSHLDVPHTKEFYSIISGLTENPKNLNELKEIFVKHKKLSQLIEAVLRPIENLKSSDVRNMLILPEFSEVKKIVGNIEETENILIKVDGYIEKNTEIDTSGLNLLTIHKSKGLESDYVFIVGATDGVLPQLRTGTSMEGQRRLMFVAVTRCKKALYISTAVIWNLKGGLVNKVQKDKFHFDFRKRVYQASASQFLSEMECQVEEHF